MELTREIRDKRVAVAGDVLAQMERRDSPLQVVSGNGYVIGYLDGAYSPDDDLSEHIDQIQENCEVCAKGAMLLSYARLFDHVPLKTIFDVEEWDEDDEEATDSINAEPTFIEKALSSVFDKLTLDRMEAAFECYGNHRPEVREAAVWGLDFKDAEDRLRAICRSVIDHDGEFVVPAPSARRAGDPDHQTGG